TLFRSGSVRHRARRYRPRTLPATYLFYAPGSSADASRGADERVWHAVRRGRRRQPQRLGLGPPGSRGARPRAEQGARAGPGGRVGPAPPRQSPDPRRCSSSEAPTSTIDTAIISVEIALISGGTRCLSIP